MESLFQILPLLLVLLGCQGYECSVSPSCNSDQTSLVVCAEDSVVVNTYSECGYLESSDYLNDLDNGYSYCLSDSQGIQVVIGSFGASASDTNYIYLDGELVESFSIGYFESYVYETNDITCNEATNGTYYCNGYFTEQSCGNDETYYVVCVQLDGYPEEISYCAEDLDGNSQICGNFSSSVDVYGRAGFSYCSDNGMVMELTDVWDDGISGCGVYIYEDEEIVVNRVCYDASYTYDSSSIDSSSGFDSYYAKLLIAIFGVCMVFLPS